jgi:hypothetical protein
MIFRVSAAGNIVVAMTEVLAAVNILVVMVDYQQLLTL